MRNRNFFSNRQAAWITQLLAENERLRRLERGIFMWMLRFTQGYVSLPTVKANLQGKLDERSIQTLYNCVFNKPRHYRNRAFTILFYFYGISNAIIVKFLNIAPRTVSKYICRFNTTGADAFLDWSHKKTKKFNDERYKEAIFAILHAPPFSYDINRTTWKFEDIHWIMISKGLPIGRNYISKIIKDAGYKWRKAKVVLTSNDPKYREKLAHIQSILSTLGKNDRFCSIDEFGPFAVKMKGGRRLVAPDEYPSVPQFQVSKGYLIITAALELSTNQVTHFYSKKKNTAEMIKLLEILLEEYKGRRKLYLSWDAASWHASNMLYERVDEVNEIKYRRAHKTPFVELAPLPASAQFLNVIESVFSGMAKAIIHNSNYASVAEAKRAIDRHFTERNEYFQKHPKRAGNKIWGKELVPSHFSEANNCKDPKW